MADLEQCARALCKDQLKHKVHQHVLNGVHINAQIIETRFVKLHQCEQKHDREFFHFAEHLISEFRELHYVAIGLSIVGVTRELLSQSGVLSPNRH